MIFDFFRKKNIETTNLNSLKTKVDQCVNLYEQDAISQLQYALYELYENFNKPGAGIKIINYPEKEKLAECFCFMLLYDWMNDNEIREVWAENAFYCIMSYYEEKFGSQIPIGIEVQTNTQQVDYATFALDFFLIVFNGSASLKTKMQDCLGNSPFSNFFLFAAKVIQPIEEKFHVLNGDDLEKYNRSIMMGATIERMLGYSDSNTWEQMLKVYRAIESILKIM